MGGDISHQVLLWAIGAVGGLVSVVFWLTIGILKDHVNRGEYDALVARVDRLAENQAGVMARLTILERSYANTDK